MYQQDFVQFPFPPFRPMRNGQIVYLPTHERPAPRSRSGSTSPGCWCWTNRLQYPKMPVSRDDCGGRCQGNAQLAGRARAVHERLMETLRRMVPTFYHNVLPLVKALRSATASAGPLAARARTDRPPVAHAQEWPAASDQPDAVAHSPLRPSSAARKWERRGGHARCRAQRCYGLHCSGRGLW